LAGLLALNSASLPNAPRNAAAHTSLTSLTSFEGEVVQHVEPRRLTKATEDVENRREDHRRRIGGCRILIEGWCQPDRLWYVLQWDGLQA
jgi:hypothetical protein